MASEDFSKDELSPREKNMVRMRSITNYVMGIFLIGAGAFFMFPLQSTKQYIDQYDPVVIKIFAAVCFIYGAFRIYRGYKKNYFRD